MPGALFLTLEVNSDIQFTTSVSEICDLAETSRWIALWPLDC